MRLARDRAGFRNALAELTRKPRALIHVEVADAGVVAGVEVVDAREAGLRGRFGERIENVPAQTLFGDAPLAARAVQVAVRCRLHNDRLHSCARKSGSTFDQRQASSPVAAAHAS